MEAHKHPCLNCGAIPISTYCHDCGQKSDTHRITVPHLVKHDLVHGLWHFDKGLLFTLREVLLRPGHMALGYIKGKRVRYYNVFYLILIVLGINLLAAHYLKVYYKVSEEVKPQGLVVSKNNIDISYYITHYFKLGLFLVIPFFALSGLISFRRLKLNFAEHTIIAGTILLAGAMWYFFVIVGMYTSIGIESDIYNILVWAFVVIAWLQPGRIYYYAARKEYTKGGFVLRMLQWHVCLALLFYIILRGITAFTGKVNITLS